MASKPCHHHVVVRVRRRLPHGYLGWFANAFTTAGAFTGIGPHYYLPSVVPLAVLAAVGACDVLDRRAALRPALRPVVASATVAVLLAATVVAALPKWHVRLSETRYEQRFQRDVQHGVQQRGDRPAVVVLPPASGTDGVMRLHGFLANRPDLGGPVVYALDRGAGLFDLLQQQPDRVPFRLTTELAAGSELSMPDPVIQPIKIVHGATVEVRTRLTNASPAPGVAATLEQGKRVVSVLLDERSRAGRTYNITWILTSDGSVQARVNGRPQPIRLRLDMEGEVGFGIASGPDRSVVRDPDPSRVVQRVTYRMRPAERSLQASTATADYVRFGGATGAWLPIDVSAQIRTSVTAR